MNNPSPLRWIGFALSLIAVVFAAELLAKHARGTSDPGLLGALCGKEHTGCDKVVASRFGYFPFAPKSAEPVSGAGVSGGDASPENIAALRKGRIPVAALGLFYYTFLAVYLGLIGIPRGKMRRLHSLVLAVVALGVIGSIVFLGIMWGVIGATCTLCLITHLCNFALAFLVWKLRPLSPKGAENADGGAEPVASFPDRSLGLAACALVVAFCLAEWNSYRALYAQTQVAHYSEAAKELRDLQDDTDQMGALLEQNAALKKRVGELTTQLEAALAGGGDASAAELARLREELEEKSAMLEDLDIVIAGYDGQEKADIPIRDDDPRIPPVTFGPADRTGYYMQVVIYGDPECPNCHDFYTFLKEEIIPTFAGHLEVIYKHSIPGKHKDGLVGARALEAARLQGNEFFWKMHEYLYDRFETLGGVDYAAAAVAIGLQRDRFLADMNSGAVTARLNEDMMHASRVLRIAGTPAIYLNKRPVSRAIRRSIGFWKVYAMKLKERREGTKPPQPW
ncbi:MAG: thioredoxin domain-containing protein [Planctomycetes bacterium]|nr:thioredoxin domain-containing protein [Planctomycetota bacterium]